MGGNTSTKQTSRDLELFDITPGFSIWTEEHHEVMRTICGWPDELIQITLSFMESDWDFRHVFKRYLPDELLDLLRTINKSPVSLGGLLRQDGGEAEDLCIRVNVVGKNGCGRTSLALCVAQGIFDNRDGYDYGLEDKYVKDFDVDLNFIANVRPFTVKDLEGNHSMSMQSVSYSTHKNAHYRLPTGPRTPVYRTNSAEFTNTPSNDTMNHMAEWNSVFTCPSDETFSFAAQHELDNPRSRIFVEDDEFLFPIQLQMFDTIDPSQYDDGKEHDEDNHKAALSVKKADSYINIAVLQHSDTRGRTTSRSTSRRGSRLYGRGGSPNPDRSPGPPDKPTLTLDGPGSDTAPQFGDAPFLEEDWRVDGFILCFDVTNRASFNFIKKLYKKVTKRHKKIWKEYFCVCVACKVDKIDLKGTRTSPLKSREISTYEALAWCRKHAIPYVETSALQNVNCRDALVQCIAVEYIYKRRNLLH